MSCPQDKVEALIHYLEEARGRRTELLAWLFSLPPLASVVFIVSMVIARELGWPRWLLMDAAWGLLAAVAFPILFDLAVHRREWAAIKFLAASEDDRAVDTLLKSFFATKGALRRSVEAALARLLPRMTRDDADSLTLDARAALARLLRRPHRELVCGAIHVAALVNNLETLESVEAIAAGQSPVHFPAARDVNVRQAALNAFGSATLPRPAVPVDPRLPRPAQHPDFDRCTLLRQSAE